MVRWGLELLDLVVRVASGGACRCQLVEGGAPDEVLAGLAVQVAGQLLVRQDVEDLLLLALAEDRAQDVQLHAVLDQATEVEGVVRLGLGAFAEEDALDRGDLEDHGEGLAETPEERRLPPYGLTEDVGVLQDLRALLLVEETDADRRKEQVVLGQCLEEALQLLDVLGLEAVGVDGGLLGLRGLVADLRVGLVVVTKLFGHGCAPFGSHVAVATSSQGGYCHASHFG